MRTFHTGGVAGGDDITQGLPRVEELFEARTPTGKALIAEIDGVIKRFDTVKDFCDYIDIARKSFYFDFQRGKNSKNWKLLSYNRYGDKGQETIEIRIARK